MARKIAGVVIIRATGSPPQTISLFRDRSQTQIRDHSKPHMFRKHKFVRLGESAIFDCCYQQFSYAGGGTVLSCSDKMGARLSGGDEQQHQEGHQPHEKLSHDLLFADWVHVGPP
jgi:hypothetical protein